MFPPEGAGWGAGARLPAENVLENLGSLEFPTHESQVCQKSPGGALRTEQNFILYNISGHT